MRIARKDLRHVLVEAVCASAKIRRATTCTHVRQLDDGRLRIQLVNEGSVKLEEDCDSLMAADGTSSKIRTCLRPDNNLQFAGSVQTAGTAGFETAIHPPLDTSYGGVLTGTSAACFFSRLDQHSLVWAQSILEPTPRAKHDNSAKSRKCFIK